MGVQPLWQTQGPSIQEVWYVQPLRALDDVHIRPCVRTVSCYIGVLVSKAPYLAHAEGALSNTHPRLPERNSRPKVHE